MDREDGRLPEPLHFSGASWKAGLSFEYYGGLPGIGQVLARDTLLSIAENSVEPLLGGRGVKM